jgi:hypothetical protein
MTGGIVPGAAPTGGTAATTGATGGIVPGEVGTGGTASGSAFGAPATSGGTADTAVTVGVAPGGNVTTGLNSDGSIGQVGRVGTALNGKPIGSPGSGLGSRGDSAGPTTLNSGTQ